MVVVTIGEDFKCGCRCSMGRWFLCDKHESELIYIIEKAELNKSNTISDVVRNGKGNVKKFVNERPMEEAK